ncbi:hypothetical protein IFM58399_01600 [Aspergillus lentulus]|uniref:uncharacterized protein n=1 Tax=Aspergillus lentulus TaxID=293939 RepID=UPI00139528BE|nr:uncharacterized protein IFM58399_01600 [Aspergillus lentulus]GFF27081.1 hypothetical protein IFM58399_01600 [Aspergillus lentulus]
MSLASSKRGPQSRPISPRRSRRLAKQRPEIDAREAAWARQRSASKANRQQPVNGMPERPETFNNLIDTARATVERYVNGGRPHEEYLRASLKAFLEWLPPGGQTSVARDIVNAGNDDQKLWQVFHDLLAYLLYPMMAESPIPSEPESPFDFREPNLEVFTGTLIQPEVRDSDFRDECARRDGYRCCVTGHLDTKKWKQNGYLPADELHDFVECANIIPCSYTSWAGSKRNGIITMPPSRASLPDPAYLDCHYRVAEILHASGLAEYIERKIQDWEDLKQSGGTDGALRPDGSTDVTRILNTALWSAVEG